MFSFSLRFLNLEWWDFLLYREVKIEECLEYNLFIFIELF